MIRNFGKAAGRKRIVLAALVSLVILAVLAYKTGVRLDKIAEQLRRMDLRIFLATLVFSVLWHVFLGADKWWRIMRAQGADVRYWEVFRVRFGSDPIRFAVPLKAGELVNAAYFAKLESLGFSRAAGSVVFDKALNFFGTVFWLYVGVAAMAEMPPAGYLGLHTAMGAGVLVLICVRPARQAAVALAGLMHRKLGKLAAGVLSAFEEFSPLQKIGFLLYGIVFQLRPLAVCALILVASQPDRIPSVEEFLALGSVVVLMSNIPSVGGIGPREAALVAVFSGRAFLGLDPADEGLRLFSIGLLMSFSVQVLPAILGIPLMFPLLRAVTPEVEGKKGTAETKGAEPICRDDCRLASHEPGPSPLSPSSQVE